MSTSNLPRIWFSTSILHLFKLVCRYTYTHTQVVIYIYTPTYIYIYVVCTFPTTARGLSPGATHCLECPAGQEVRGARRGGRFYMNIYICLFPKGYVSFTWKIGEIPSFLGEKLELHLKHQDEQHHFMPMFFLFSILFRNTVAEFKINDSRLVSIVSFFLGSGMLELWWNLGRR